MKLTIRKSKNKQFYFVITAKNGEPVLTSETYLKRPVKFSKMIALRLGADWLDESR